MWAAWGCRAPLQLIIPFGDLSPHRNPGHIPNESKARHLVGDVGRAIVSVLALYPKRYSP